MSPRRSLAVPIAILMSLALMGIMAREILRAVRPAAPDKAPPPSLREAEPAPAPASASAAPDSGFVPVPPDESKKTESHLEWETRYNLQKIRSAISWYRRVNKGKNPPDLSFIQDLPPVTATHEGIGNGTFESPAGSGVSVTANDSITMIGVGWRYNPVTGQVRVNSAATDSRGNAYSSY